MAQHKRGDTFEMSGNVYIAVDGAPLPDFTGWTGSCQLRNTVGKLIADLVFEWLDVSQGLVRIYSSASTQEWPVGILKTDIQLTSADGVVVSTDTAAIEIVEDITR